MLCTAVVDTRDEGEKEVDRLLEQWKYQQASNQLSVAELSAVSAVVKLAKHHVALRKRYRSQ